VTEEVDTVDHTFKLGQGHPFTEHIVPEKHREARGVEDCKEKIKEHAGIELLKHGTWLD
jgi:hypothetical protein